jgi:adenylate cyclase
VDLAARISGLARPAQVLMSSGVADSARQHLDAGAFDQPILWRTYGGYSLKGFDEPLEIREAGLEGVAPFEAPAASEKAKPIRRKIWRAAILPVAVVAAALTLLIWLRVPDRSHPADAGESASTGAQMNEGDAPSFPGFSGRPAIAVLPFDNLSPDPEQAFFADGLAEDLITRLSAWRAFPVIARNSSFQYRGGNLDLKRVSRELGVRYLVEGSVRRAGDRIRVTAQLIDAPSGEHVWAESYDREVEDVFALQDEISSTIAASVAGDLTRAEGERARRQGTENLEAWSLYQLGLQHSDRYAPDDWAQAVRLFERAVELDPRFAAAVANVAMAELWTAVFKWNDTPDQKVSAALETARRAVELDPRDPIAQVALSFAYVMAGDVQNGLDSAQRALDLNPSMPEAWNWLGYAKLLAGDPQGCIAATEQAQRLNPQGTMAWLGDDNLTMAYWEVGNYEAALDAARRLRAARPAYPYGHLYVALSAVELGHLDEARAAVAEARRLQPDVSLEMIQRGYGVSRPEVDARRNAALRKAGLQ